MKIIILGAGQVGGSLAENLVNEKNDITIVDINSDVLHSLQDKFDLRVIQGEASNPRILKEAGAEDADMIIAVTNSDEVNMIACQIGFSLFNTPSRVARIRNPDYLNLKSTLFNNESIPISHLITPEILVTDYIYRLIEYPGSLQVSYFSDEKVGLVAINAYYGGPLVGQAISTLRDHMPHIEVRVAAIFRRGKPIRPQGTTIIEAGDEVFFVTETIHIRAVMGELQRLETPYQRIMIIGGGNIGADLAKRLEKNYHVKLIEQNLHTAEKLSESLEHCIVFCGDASDQELLNEEHIDQIDVFITVTNDDEANIMSGMLAKKMGAKKVMALIQRNAYLELIDQNIIDITISPQQTTISALLTHVRKADIVNVFSLRRGVAEAIEAVVHGDEQSSQVIGKTVEQFKLPPGTTVGAIVRGNDVYISHQDVVIETNDHIILFLVDKKYIVDVEKLFQPSVLFL